MPTILRVGPYRFFFYSGDRGEPKPVHVEREDNIAKFWMDPIRLQNSGGFRRSEIIRLMGIINEYSQQIMEAWYEYFGH